MARKAQPVAGVYEKFEGTGIFYVRYRLNGHLVRKKVGTRSQAIDYLNKVKHIRASGSGIVPANARQPARTFAELAKASNGVTLGNLCDGLLKQIENDRDRYRDQHNPPIRIARIKDQFGTRSALSIRPHEISDWISALKAPSGKRLAAGTRNRYKTVFSSIYEYGKEREQISVNPVREVKGVKEGEGVIRYLDPEEETRLRRVIQADIDACELTQPTLKKRFQQHMYEIDIALGTGARRGEQYRITWDDVNFDRREIILQKTKYGPARTVHLITDVVEALRGLQKIHLIRRRRSKDKPNGAPANTIFSLSDNKKWFQSALHRAEVKKFRWHDLRHTFCSRLVQKGVNLKIVQVAAGHRNIAMTARYAHLDNRNLAEAMALLNREV